MDRKKCKATPKAVRGHQIKNITHKIELGDKARSKVSGFHGTVTSICSYLYGESRYEVTSPEPIDGEVKTVWFSAAELEVNEAAG